MLRKPKKEKKKEKRKKKVLNLQKFREKLTLVRFEPNFWQLVILIFFFSDQLRKSLGYTNCFKLHSGHG